MRTLLFASGLLSCLTICSFRMADDTTCYINYSGVDSQGCTTTVAGSYDCNSANPITTFLGTIALGGDGDCLNASVISAYAVQDIDGNWIIPTGYQVAFYTDRPDNFCESTSLTFIGYNANIAGQLNKLSGSILDEFKSDAGC